MKGARLWFAEYNENYNGNEPFFYDTNQLRVANILRNNSSDIINDLKILWQKGDNGLMKNYGDDGLQFPPKTWSKLVFKVWGLQNKAVCNRFPQLAALINAYPEITSCFISKTLAHSEIKPHCGETNATIRIHLGLKVPISNIEQCGLKVGNQKIAWEEGKTIGFYDAHKHTVWNKTDDDRYILIVDVIRPEFSNWKNFVNVRILSNQIFYTIAEKINPKKLYKIPGSFLTFIAVVSFLPFLFINFLNNRIGFFKM